MQFAGECIYEVGAIPFAGEIDAWLNSHPCLRFLKLRFAKQSTTKSTNTTKKNVFKCVIDHNLRQCGSAFFFRGIRGFSW